MPEYVEPLIATEGSPPRGEHQEKGLSIPAVFLQRYATIPDSARQRLDNRKQVSASLSSPRIHHVPLLITRITSGEYCQRIQSFVQVFRRTAIEFFRKMARCDMLLDEIPANAILIKIGDLQVSAFGQLAVCTVFLLAIAVLVFRLLHRS
jgi:hypothetical protein